MQFHGEDDEERYKVLSTLTNKFLNSIEARHIQTDKILNLWQHSFIINATKLTTFIEKKQMIWPVIAILCEVNESDARLDDYDEHDVTEIIRKYKNVINNNCERFEFITKIISDYNEFGKDMISKERTTKFVDNKWKDYEDCFDIKSAEPSVKEMIIRLTINNVLKNRSIIKKIKSKVKLL